MKKYIIYGALGVALVLLIGLVVLMPSSKDEQGPENSNATSTDNLNSGSEEEGVNPGSNLNSNLNKPAVVVKPPVSTQKISITAPVPGVQFVMNQNNTIKWSKEGGVNGAIYLIDASNNQTVGLITPSLTTHQTSYTWDTRDVLLSRQGGLKKPVTKGKYIILIKFDNAQAEVRSGEFSVVYASEVPVISYDATIQNLTLTPKSLILNTGEKVVLKNNDTVTHKMLGFSGVNLLVPGASMTIDTKIMTKGVYEFYSESYPTVKLTVTVK